MIVYLHGFASAPSSRKAQVFRESFAKLGVPIEIPQLDGHDFEHLTISSQMKVIERAADGKPVSLVGSSMGGYLAALYASRHPEVRKLVLMAPAFRFPQTWAQTLGADKVEEWNRTGKLRVYHHAHRSERLLDIGIVKDGLQYPEVPEFSQPALIFHGLRDDVVPPRYSEEFAASHPNVKLRLLDSNHELTDVIDRIWNESQAFLTHEN